MSELNNNQSILDDVSSSFKSLITERFTSPFLFSFVISWLIFNHKLLILSFTDSTDKLLIKEKFKLFDLILNSSYLEVPFADKTLLLNGFLLPLISAIFYTFLYPFADYYITRFTLERKLKLRNLRVQKEREAYYTFEDVQKIYSRHTEEEKGWKLRIERAEVSDAQKDALIVELQARLNELDNAKVTTTTAPEETDVRSILLEAKKLIALNKHQDATELLEDVKARGTAYQKRQARELLKELAARVGILNDDEVNRENTFSESESALVNLLANSANSNVDWVEERAIFKDQEVSPVEKKIAIDDLITKNLIIRKYRPELGGMGLQLTVQGMKLYKKLK